MTVLGGIPGSHKEQLCDTLLYLTESHIRSVNIIHTIYIASRARYKNICPKVIEKPLESFVTPYQWWTHTVYGFWNGTCILWYWYFSVLFLYFKKKILKSRINIIVKEFYITYLMCSQNLLMYCRWTVLRQTVGATKSVLLGELQDTLSKMWNAMRRRLSASDTSHRLLLVTPG